MTKQTTVSQKAHDLANDQQLSHIDWDTKYNLAYEAYEQDFNADYQSVINWILS